MQEFDGDFEGRVAFITGGANGIGRAIAKSCARAGAAVAIADIDMEAAKQTAAELEAEGGRALAVSCDVTSRESIERAADATWDGLGAVQILVNNAGAFAYGMLDETDAKDWEWLLSINVMGVVNGLHTFLPRMRAHGRGGHILNTASISGHIPTPGLSVYTATKYAVVGLSECLHLELGEENIGVSILCPGIVKTGLIESSAQLRPEVYGGPLDPEGNELRSVIESGSDPAEVGEHVVQGIRRGELYIFVHPDLSVAVKFRHGQIQAAYERQR